MSRAWCSTCTRPTGHADDIDASKFGKKFFVSGLANKGLVLTPINDVNGVAPADLQKEVDAVVADLASGKKTLPNFFQWSSRWR